jgi:flagellum-specific ATP synthase
VNAVGQVGVDRHAPAIEVAARQRDLPRRVGHPLDGERVGSCAGAGTLTGLYTVLVEGDDLSDPIADAARSILDGHIVLTRELASQGHYPAIDMLHSISRVMPDITGESQRSYARHLVELLSVHKRAEDLINLGAYKPGASSRIDLAIRMRDPIMGFLRQDIEERVSLGDSAEALSLLFNQCEGAGASL